MAERSRSRVEAESKLNLKKAEEYYTEIHGGFTELHVRPGNPGRGLSEWLSQAGNLPSLNVIARSEARATWQSPNSEHATKHSPFFH